VGANNLFNVYPDKYNPDLVAAQRAGLDNAAVAQYANFSPFGINGGYYYVKMKIAF
jgi:iron complex outermembrane receptor protein